MKRTFKGKVFCRRISPRVVHVHRQGSPYNFLVLWPEDCQAIFGFCPARGLGVAYVDLTVRLIGEPSPWREWTWGMGVYEPGHLILEAERGLLGDKVLRIDGFADEGTGREFLASICASQTRQVFPGLFEAIGIYNACEAEVISRRLPKKEGAEDETHV